MTEYKICTIFVIKGVENINKKHQKILTGLILLAILVVIFPDNNNYEGKTQNNISGIKPSDQGNNKDQIILKTVGSCIGVEDITTNILCLTADEKKKGVIDITDLRRFAQNMPSQK